MEAIISFLINSDNFSGFATILTGLVAVGIYFKQKSDQRAQIARLIVLEIRMAEEKISQITDQIEGNSNVDYPSVLPVNSWKKYAYLFVRDFDNDELKLINSFYDICEAVEDFAKRDNNFFWVTTEERAKVTQSMLGEVFDTAYEMAVEDRDFYISSKKNFITNSFDKHGLVYFPQKSQNEIKKLLNRIQYITTSQCGTKLKKIANMK